MQNSRKLFFIIKYPPYLFRCVNFGHDWNPWPPATRSSCPTTTLAHPRYPIHYNFKLQHQRCKFHKMIKFQNVTLWTTLLWCLSTFFHISMMKWTNFKTYIFDLLFGCVINFFRDLVAITLEISPRARVVPLPLVKTHPAEIILALKNTRHMSRVTRKPIFGVFDHERLKPACSATETT